MDKVGYIYSLNDPFTGGVRYIGKTNDLMRRYNCHVRVKSINRVNTHKEKWINSLRNKNCKPIMKVLFQTSYDNLDFLEIEMIKHYKRFVKLTNGTDGGDGMIGYKMSDEKRLFRKLNPKFGTFGEEARKRVSDRMKTDINPGKRQNKVVLQHNMDGTFVKEYPSVITAAKENNCARSGISRCCNGGRRLFSIKGFMWSFKSSNDKFTC